MVAVAGEEKVLRCGHCSRRLPERTPGPGRPRQWCTASCRQLAYQARQRAKELGLSDAELVMARTELDKLRDDLYVLECAVDDVDRDIVEAESEADVRRALEWLLQAARPLVRHSSSRRGMPR